MAKSKQRPPLAKDKTGQKIGKPFEKGNKFGKGHPPVPEDVKDLRLIHRDEFTRRANKYLTMNVKDLREALNSQEAEALDVMVCMVIYKTIKEGCHHRLNFLLERIIGKVKDPKRTVNFNFGQPVTEFNLINDQLEMISMEIERLKAKAREEPLTFDDHRSMKMLSDTMRELIDKRKDTDFARKMAQSSTADLVKETEALISDIKRIESKEVKHGKREE